MAIFQGKRNINCLSTDIYRFLANFSNHQQLMPDTIQNWASTSDGASFSIQNMVQLSLQITERIENKLIKIIATGSPPFPVGLNWELEADNDSTYVTFTINAELNMMMKMMASGPLQKLANHEVEELERILEK